MAISLNPVSWLNLPMLSAPLNWAIVGVVASIWLFVVHSVMTGFGAMQSGGTGQAVGGGGPGTIAAPGAGTAFAIAGDTGGGLFGDGNQWFGSDPTWGANYEAKWAEDGWTGDS